MAQYVTLAEFQAQGLPSEALSGLSNDLINQALLWASGKADTFLRKRYALPLLVYDDPALKEIITDLAAWRLLKRKGFNPAAPAHQAIIQGNLDAMAALKAIAAGDQELGVTDSSDALDEAGTLAQSDTAETFRYFTGDDCG